MSFFAEIPLAIIYFLQIVPYWNYVGALHIVYETNGQTRCHGEIYSWKPTDYRAWFPGIRKLEVLNTQKTKPLLAS
jgi:hypothetical protein